MGLKLDGSAWLAPDFLSRLASRAITTANTSEHDFSSDVGTMSSGEDLAGILRMTRSTSAAVTAVKPVSLTLLKSKSNFAENVTVAFTSSSSQQSITDKLQLSQE